MIRTLIISIILFFAYLLVQVLLLRNVVLFDTAFCFLYIAFILLLPVEISTVMVMLAGFLIGFSVDMFYSSLGLHAFATVFTAYLRNYWLKAITPQSGYDIGDIPSLSTNGIGWFLVFALPLIFVHHFILFFLEASGFNQGWFTLLKVAASLFFTSIVLLLLQSLSPERRK